MPIRLIASTRETLQEKDVHNLTMIEAAKVSTFSYSQVSIEFVDPTSVDRYQWSPWKFQVSPENIVQEIKHQDKATLSQQVYQVS